jgi:hypothetical protein
MRTDTLEKRLSSYAGSNGYDDIMTFDPLTQKSRYKLWGVLQVGVNTDDGICGLCLMGAGSKRDFFAEIS